VRDQQTLVNNIVGLDFDMWRMCVYLGQGPAPLARSLSLSILPANLTSLVDGATHTQGPCPTS
jgi:hypothetical protein